MKCFYHSSDLDGHCSGALVKMAFPECEMVKINYDNLVPIEEIFNDLINKGFNGETITYDKLFMVDFSYPVQDMFDLMKVLKNQFIWIDHHKSAIEECKHLNINGIQDYMQGRAACSLVWQYLHHTKPEPYFVKLLALYDVWNHQNPDVLLFQYGMRQFKNTFPDNQKLWSSLFDEKIVKKIIKTGSIILDYQDAQNEKYINSYSFDTELDGLKCIACNKGMANSKLFDSMWNPEEHDAMLTFVWRRGQWTVSLYSDKNNIDVSKIAKNRGGGGHKGAAGFQCKELPFSM